MAALSPALRCLLYSSRRRPISTLSVCPAMFKRWLLPAESSIRFLVMRCNFVLNESMLCWMKLIQELSPALYFFYSGTFILGSHPCSRHQTAHPIDLDCHASVTHRQSITTILLKSYSSFQLYSSFKALTHVPVAADWCTENLLLMLRTSEMRRRN